MGVWFATSLVIVRDVARVDREDLLRQLRADGLDVTEWSDEPDAAYPEHAHRTREVRIVLDGTMTVVVGGTSHALGPGDRIDLPPGEPHSALVGPEGCSYLAGSER